MCDIKVLYHLHLLMPYVMIEELNRSKWSDTPMLQDVHRDSRAKGTITVNVVLGAHACVHLARGKARGRRM